MTITREQLRRASLWNERLCLDCEDAYDPTASAPFWICPECGGDATLSPQLAERFLLEFQEEDTP